MIKKHFLMTMLCLKSVWLWFLIIIYQYFEINFNLNRFISIAKIKNIFIMSKLYKEKTILGIYCKINLFNQNNILLL